MHDPAVRTTEAARFSLIATGIFPGYLRGLAQPSLGLKLRVREASPAGKLTIVWPDLVPLPAACHLRVATGQLAQLDSYLLLLAEFLIRIQVNAGLTVSSGAFLESVQSLPGQPTEQEVVLLVPSPAPSALKDLAGPIVRHFNSLCSTGSDAAELPSQFVQTLASLAPGGTNNRYLLREAFALGIPIMTLPGQVFQLGWGRHARLFRSSITDQTSAVSTNWAKDKHACNRLLRMAGLPVPDQALVTSLEAALQATSKITYPVVLKPAQLDQGQGVEANLRSEAELRQAYARSSQYARELVLEKHMPGEDYRVYVVQGEMLGVAHRIPARVVGDGVSSIRQLVSAANARRQMQAGAAPSLYKPIQLDQEAEELIARAGLMPDSLLPEGQVLTLCRSANTSRGGTSVDVTLLAHPDNVDLCVRAAALLRLDIAGLDLIMPDISRSWREVGAGFCEINAQPQMGGAHPWIFERILRRYLVGRGRIPTVLVLTDSAHATGLGAAIAKSLARSGLGTRAVAGGATELLRQCSAELMAPDLDALVVQTDGSDLSRVGLPLDRFDVLVVAQWRPAPAQARAILALLPPHLSGPVLLGPSAVDSSETRLRQQWLSQAFGVQRVRLVQEESALPEAVLQAVQDLTAGG